MQRHARIIIDNYPHHIIKRGHNRQVVFASDDVYLFYLDNLEERKDKFECKIYACCLKTNHVHLVIQSQHGRAQLVPADEANCKEYGDTLLINLELLGISPCLPIFTRDSRSGAEGLESVFSTCKANAA